MSHDALGTAEEIAAVQRWAGQLLDAAPDAMIVVGSDETIAFVNAQAERLFGYARAELLGATLSMLIPQRFRPTHGSHVAGFFARPSMRSMGSGLELFGRHKDGSEIPVEVSLSPVASPTGPAVCAAIRDIGDRKRIEIAAKVNADRLATAIESIEDALALFDASDRLVLCNSAYRGLVGSLVSGPLIGKPYAEALSAWFGQLGSIDAAERARLEGEHAAGRHESRRFEVRGSDGRSFRVMERPTVEAGVVQTIWDLTQDVRHADELHEARLAAEAASAAKSEFLSSMSHELRTPLNAILGFAQLLQRDKKAPLSERHRERIEHILKGGEHLLRLIDDVLDLSHIEAGRVSVSTEPVALADVFREVETTLGPMAARAEVALIIEAPAAGMPPVIADRTRLKQILMNYGSNAIKYGRKGGHATFTAEARGACVRVAVADDGLGIALDKQEKIFQPFQRAGQETGPIEGTGIGLAITKRLAELMGGHVGFESTAAKGSRFWIDLPVHAAKPQQAEVGRVSQRDQESALASAEGERYLVIYIEDNPSNIAFMADLLADFERVELLTAPTAEIGIELVRARGPAAVIMDINLPGMSGIEATQLLKQWPETVSIPVIALSAAAMVKDAAKIAEVGFYRYLTKPVQVDVLAAVLEELLLSHPDK